jgi:glucose 1-dehydrogenase
MDISGQSIQLPNVVMPSCPEQKILRGQRALVTGANSGIGRSIALALGQAGADVVVNYRRAEGQATEVVQEIGRAGSRAYAHQADVSQENQVQEMFQL